MSDIVAADTNRRRYNRCFALFVIVTLCSTMFEGSSARIDNAETSEFTSNTLLYED